MALRTIDEIRDAADDWHNPYTMYPDVYGPKPEGATTVNTDANEKMLALSAFNFGRIRPPVKRVKGFDQNTVKAERRKAARAKQHNKRMRRNPSHASHTKAPAV